MRKSNQILFLYLCYRNEVYWHLSGFAGCGSLHGNSIAYLQFCCKEEIGVGPLKPVGRFWVLCSSPNGCFIPTDLLVSPMSAKIRAEHRCPARMGRENLFRGLLFCDCCSDPLTMIGNKLNNCETDIYLFIKNSSPTRFHN